MNDSFFLLIHLDSFALLCSAQVAFCCISTGLFGYPAAEAADVALTAVRRHMRKELSTLHRMC